ncbi:hypothetical protein GCG21_08550 [Pseudactinotalea sp. HY160]|uniref:hypothetical protein n=1 Tax=Pseudactinotalea sp. HY160 TaxID=2654490 RepID=UPI00128BD816|nr:hypothetical protein [Pseudactinotalea sp. HY160]MPV50053.1 hypothetical protein [Pseudactinotalea sp. HY160]
MTAPIQIGHAIFNNCVFTTTTATPPPPEPPRRARNAGLAMLIPLLSALVRLIIRALSEFAAGW